MSPNRKPVAAAPAQALPSATATPTPAPVPAPTLGGSYEVQPDGKLERVQCTDNSAPEGQPTKE
jgi:hypothetical protein